MTIPARGSPRLVELADGDAVRGWQRRLSADLDLLANAGLPTALRAAATRSLRRGAAELGELLAAAVPNDDRAVVISPASELLVLPWPLLPRLRGTSGVRDPLPQRLASRPSRTHRGPDEVVDGRGR